MTRIPSRFLFDRVLDVRLRRQLEIVLLLSILLFSANVNAAFLGIGFNNPAGANLVSFDPYTGVVVNDYGIIHPTAEFQSMAYDAARNRLLLLDNSGDDIYAIDTVTLDVTFIGKFPKVSPSGYLDSLNGLTYDAATDTIYGISNWKSRNTLIDPTPRENHLLTLDPTDLSVVTDTVTTAVVFIGSNFNPVDGLIYGANFPGPWPNDQPFPDPYFASIDPSTGIVADLIMPPVRISHGFAVSPGGTKFIGHSFAGEDSFWELDIVSQSATQLAGTGSTGDMLTIINFDFALTDGQLNTFDTGPPSPPIPLPPAIWLLGSALGILSWMKRKTE